MKTKSTQGSNQDWVVTGISIAGIAIVVALLAIRPEESKAFIETIFNFTINNFGAPLIWTGLIALIYSLYMAFSKYGKIRLGDSEPIYSDFGYFSMLFCAGVSSSALYWSMTEWVHYYVDPPFGILALSAEAAEMATAYNMFHWGLIPWAAFSIAAIPVAYAYHIRKIGALRMSTVVRQMIPNSRYKEIIGKIVDIVFVFNIAGCCGIVLGMGVPMVSNGISKVTGIAMGTELNLAVIVAIALVFTVSSYLGTKNGMQVISRFNVIAAMLFMLFLLCYGPTNFILRQTTNGAGLMVQNFARMSTYTDPVLNGGFPDAWTIFFIAYGYAFAMILVLFVAKISAGRTIKSMILNVVFGGSTGCLLFFGINGSFSMSTHLAGLVDAVALSANAGGNELIMQTLLTIPLGKIVILYFILVAALFLSTSADSATFSLAATTTKNLASEEEISPMTRLFWCVVVAAIPLTMISIGAPLSAFQTIIIIVAMPMMIVCFCMCYWLRNWIKEDIASGKILSEVDCKVKVNK